MLKGKRKIARLNMNLPRGGENGLKPNALCSHVAVRTGFGALANRADRREIFGPESILIAVYNYTIGMDAK